MEYLINQNLERIAKALEELSDNILEMNKYGVKVRK